MPSARVLMPGENDVRTTVLTLPKSRVARIAGQAAVLLTLVAGTAAYAANDTTVTLSVDGEEQEVRAFGRTVDAVLKAADVEVGARDVVAPGLGERVSDGAQVVVRHARLLTLTLDGSTQQRWTTALTVDEALRDLDVRADGARLSVSRSTPVGRSGLALEVVTPKDVTVLVDAQAHAVNTTAPTVGDLLTEMQVQLGPIDRVSVPLEDALTHGAVVQVSRVNITEVTETQAIPYETQKIEDGSLYEGQKQVETRGKAGSRLVTWAVTLVDGVEESRGAATTVLASSPVTQVERVGTAPRPTPALASAPAVADGSVWDRLAQCESGGNWQINTGNGYYGGLQFSASSWRAVGGTGLPHQHSREVQIQMGERLQAKQGWGAWPACSRKLGLR